MGSFSALRTTTRAELWFDGNKTTQASSVPQSPSGRNPRALGVPPRRINEIVLGKRAVTADSDLRLARYFGMSDGFFIGLQVDFELLERRRKIAQELKSIRPRAA